MSDECAVYNEVLVEDVPKKRGRPRKYPEGREPYRLRKDGTRRSPDAAPIRRVRPNSYVARLCRLRDDLDEIAIRGNELSEVLLSLRATTLLLSRVNYYKKEGVWDVRARLAGFLFEETSFATFNKKELAAFGITKEYRRSLHSLTLKKGAEVPSNWRPLISVLELCFKIIDWHCAEVEGDQPETKKRWLDALLRSAFPDIHACTAGSLCGSEGPTVVAVYKIKGEGFYRERPPMLLLDARLLERHLSEVLSGIDRGKAQQDLSFWARKAEKSGVKNDPLNPITMLDNLEKSMLTRNCATPGRLVEAFKSSSGEDRPRLGHLSVLQEHTNRFRVL